MPHSFGCKATDWLRGINSSCKEFHTWNQCCQCGWSLNCQVLKGAGVSEQYTNDVFKTIRNIHIMCS